MLGAFGRIFKFNKQRWYFPWNTVLTGKSHSRPSMEILLVLWPGTVLEKLTGITILTRSCEWSVFDATSNVSSVCSNLHNKPATGTLAMGRGVINKPYGYAGSSIKTLGLVVEVNTQREHLSYHRVLIDKPCETIYASALVRKTPWAGTLLLVFCFLQAFKHGAFSSPFDGTCQEKADLSESDVLCAPMYSARLPGLP